MTNALSLARVPGKLAVCRLPPEASLPDWLRGTITSVTRTPDELSIICEDTAVPGEVQAARGWRALRVEGAMPFEITGVAAALTAPLAAAGISLLLVATFDTDYLLVREDSFDDAMRALRAAGHTVA